MYQFVHVRDFEVTYTPLLQSKSVLNKGLMVLGITMLTRLATAHDAIHNSLIQSTHPLLRLCLTMIGNIMLSVEIGKLSQLSRIL